MKTPLMLTGQFAVICNSEGEMVATAFAGTVQEARERAAYFVTCANAHESLAADNKRLREGIEKHRDQKGDDRCWLDDQELYAIVDPDIKVEGSLPPRCDFLASCERFWEQRQSTSDTFALDHPTIGQMERTIKRLRERLEFLGHENNWTRHDPDDGGCEWTWDNPFWPESGIEGNRKIVDPAAFAREALK